MGFDQRLPPFDAQEAARITGAMLVAGRELVEQAVAADGDLPSEAELAAHEPPWLEDGDATVPFTSYPRSLDDVVVPL